MPKLGAVDHSADPVAMPLDVRRSRELQAAILATRQAERDIRLDINATARRELKPVWADALRGHVDTRLEARTLLPGARIAVGARNITVHAATSKKPLSGGLVPAVDYAPIEWGSAKHRQFRGRRRDGYVVGPAAAAVITRAIALWVALVVDKFRTYAEVNR